MNYKEAGVDIEKGEKFVSFISQKVGRTFGMHEDRIVQGVGGFASLYNIGGGRYLASGTDGVGTKLKVAQLLNKHDTIGIDLVAMCVNDILCTGARPLFFLDYLATGKLNLEISNQIIEGIVEGCTIAGAALLGGETAEMPGVYPEGEYDLAGFSVGEVYAENLVDGKSIESGDAILGLASSGPHSNGFSLIRKILRPNETELYTQALEPTRIYVKSILKVLDECPGLIKGMAHITGGGFDNIKRINPEKEFIITRKPKFSEIPDIFSCLATRTSMKEEELYSTFNMGVGMVLVTSNPALLKKCLGSAGVWELGHIE